MPEQPTYPGVYIEEVPGDNRTFKGVSTSVAMFIGRAKGGPVNKPVLCLNYGDFERTFTSDTSQGDMATEVRLFFLNGGTQCYIMRIPASVKDAGDGIEPLAKDYDAAYEIIDREVDLFNLMILPKDRNFSDRTMADLYANASLFCQKKRAFLVVDPPEGWNSVKAATDLSSGVTSLLNGLVKDHCAIFYPRVTVPEDESVNVGPGGAIAGIMARIDSTRGVWKAPAGVDAFLDGIHGLEYRFSDSENGVLNQLGINTLRILPAGIVNWGARTMAGDDHAQSEYKYISVRRLALYIEESLYRGLRWVVFESNDEILWSQVLLNAGAFMHNLFINGALQGQSPKDAYFVKCDRETTTQNDINQGIVNILVGFAPLKPAEFVILHIQQMAGKINSEIKYRI
jgi:phage tail sheath protein FI